MMNTETMTGATGAAAAAVVTVEREAQDEAGRVARDTAELFTAMRRLTAAELTEALTQVRAAADDLEVEMMGGEPDEDAVDGLRGYGRGVR